MCDAEDTLSKNIKGTRLEGNNAMLTTPESVTGSSLWKFKVSKQKSFNRKVVETRLHSRLKHEILYELHAGLAATNIQRVIRGFSMSKTNNKTKPKC